MAECFNRVLELSFSVLVTGLPSTKKTGHKVKHACAHLGVLLAVLLAWCITIAVIAIINVVGHPAIYAFADGSRVKHFLSYKFIFNYLLSCSSYIASDYAV